MNNKNYLVVALHKAIVLCIAVAMFASMFTGCSPQTDADGQSPAAASEANESPSIPLHLNINNRV
jgi:flagellar basal body-associated protein FliL